MSSPARKLHPKLERYEASGLLAVDPKAFFEFFMAPDTRDNQELAGVTIVDVQGPLKQHDRGWCDSYEAIRSRVAEACARQAPVVLLRVDSPGGDAAGCFETARSIRTMCDAAGKTLLAYVEGKAMSAAYALASAASSITIADAALIGSIGVISAREDVSAMLASRGVRVAMITSGARKADGNPEIPITEAELKEAQILVDSMASVFFELVAEMRGVDAAAIEALEAKVFHGQSAIAAGLADQISSLDDVLASIANGDLAMGAKAEDKKDELTPWESARAALEETAKGSDANAAAAKRALAAMDEPAPADDDDEKKKKDEADKAAAAAAASSPIAVQALAEVHKLRAERTADKESEERKLLLASRPDFAPELAAALHTAPMATVREMVEKLPKGTIPKPADLAATGVVAATRGAEQGTGSSPESNEMDVRMGLTGNVLGVRREGNAVIFGVMQKPATPVVADGGAK